MGARRVLSVALAGAVLAGSLLSSTGVARADATWWLPSEWVTAAVGSALGAASALAGGSSGVEGASGPQLVLGEWGTPDAAIKISARLDGVLPDGRPILAYVRADAGSADWPQTGVLWGTYGLTQVYLTCVDGSVAGVPSWSAGSPVATYCNVKGGLQRVHQVAYSSGTRQVQAWSFTLTAVADPVVTTLTCRNLSTGVDTTVSESAAPPVPPSPVCPAGTVAFRVRITQGLAVLQDASISVDALTGNKGMYIGDPGDWQKVWTPGGVCGLEGTAPPTMGLTIPLSQAMCDEGPGQEIPTEDPPVDCAADIVCLAVQGVIAAVKAAKSAIDAVKGAVQGVIGAVTRGIQQVRDTIESTVDRVIEAINQVKQAIVDGVIGIGQKLDELIGQGEDPGTEPGDDGNGLEPGGIGDCVQLDNPLNPVEWVYRPLACLFIPDTEAVGDKLDELGGAVFDKLAPWTDGYNSLIHIWDMGEACDGWVFHAPAFIASSTGVSTIEIGSSCDYPVSQFAAASRAATAALLGIGAFSTGFSFLMLGLGFVGPMGGGGPRAGVDGFLALQDAQAGRDGVGQRGLPASGARRMVGGK